jgi:coenzyme F420 hydrogenase subunit delta
LSERKPAKIFIVDAVDYPDRRPGEVFEIPVEGIPAKKSSDFSLHQFPTVNMLQELKEHSPMDIKIIVTQIDTIPEEVKPGLSTAVTNAVDAACRTLLAAIREAPA